MFNLCLDEHNRLFSTLNLIKEDVDRAIEISVAALRRKNKLLICGNGGSAADSQHFAAELIGRFEIERSSIPAIALTTDTSTITAIANDYGYEKIFSRQIEGLGKPGDVLVGISTSGNSLNIETAFKTAAGTGMKTVGLLGRDGGIIAPLADVAVIVPHSKTAFIQEAHIFIIHCWCAMIEQALSKPHRESRC